MIKLYITFIIILFFMIITCKVKYCIDNINCIDNVLINLIFKIYHVIMKRILFILFFLLTLYLYNII